MSFRKRNIGVQRSPIASSPADGQVEQDIAPAPTASGIRPSPLTGQPTTSTGAYSLDSLLGGHAGLALGSSLLVEESGTTDFAGALLRYYAAEGIIQSHTVHLVGAGEQWIKDLPGLVGDAEAAEAQKQAKSDEKKMKIAWRYERLGQVDADRGSRGEQRYIDAIGQSYLTASQSSPNVVPLLSKSPSSKKNISRWPSAIPLTLQSVLLYLPRLTSTTLLCPLNYHCLPFCRTLPSD
jgi:hypothetical protein